MYIEIKLKNKIEK